MNERTIVFGIFCSLALPMPGLAADRPNIVLIISDDQSYGDFGFMGHPQIRTPNLDRLAAEAACYTHGYVPSSVCRPSLVTLLTGLYPHQHGVHFNHPPPGFARLTQSPSIDKVEYDRLRAEANRFVRDVPTLPRILASHGYRCLQTGKYWEGHWRNAGFTDGMTIAEPSSEPDALGNKRLANGELVAHGNGDHGLAIGRQTMQPIYDFVDACRQQGSPFFIWYAPFLPHLPHDAPSEFRQPYEQDSSVPQHAIPYYATCTWFDSTVGELRRYIEHSGAGRETLFVFVADNGFVPDPKRPMADGDFNYTSKSKRSPFDAGLRTPLLLYWAGHTRPKTQPQPCSSVDVLPTLLDMLDLESAAPHLPGRSLWLSATGRAELEEQPVMGAIYPGDASSLGHPERDVAYRWVRSGRFKLIVPHASPPARPWGNYLDRVSLFDILDDPDERHDLAQQPEQAQRIEQLTQLLDAWWTPAAIEAATGD